MSDIEDFQDLPKLRPCQDDDTTQESSSSDDDGPGSRLPPKVRNWTFEQRFPSYAEAKSFVVNQKDESGSKVWIYKRNSGNSIYFDCTQHKLRKCQAAVKLILDKTNQSASLFRDSTEHHHEERNSGKLTQEQKVVISEAYYQMGIKKPKGINGELRNRNMREIKSGTLSRYIRLMRDKQNPRIKSFYDFEKWCEGKFKFIPSDLPQYDLDEPFILSYQVKEDSNPSFLRVIITSRRLLMIGELAKCICADATHQLNWNKFPTLVFGTVDQNKSFHPFGVALVSHERGEDYGYVFSELKKQ